MNLTRRQLLGAAAAPAAACAFQTPDPLSSGIFRRPIVPAPDDPALWPRFREALAKWRAETRRETGYDDSIYRRPECQWAARSFCSAVVMLWDEAFHDARRREYRLDALLEDGARQYGGYDSVILWCGFPRLGIDERNQFDFYRDAGGGLDGLRRITAEFQRRGVRVYLNYNPWDSDTRREDACDDEVLARMVKALGVDALFLDTMNTGSAGLRAKLEAVRPGIAMEGERQVYVPDIAVQHMSWGQAFADSRVPGVLRNKWFERRHMVHMINRFARDHSGDLHVSWMNGSGTVVWENAFGTMVGWSARDRSYLRSVLSIQRRYAALFSGEGWTPLVPTEQAEVYASLWEQGGVRLWTLVNRSAKAVSGAMVRVQGKAGERYFDLVLGKELAPGKAAGDVSFSGVIEPRGIGCFLASPAGGLGGDFGRFLQAQAALAARADFDPASFKPAIPKLRPVAPTAPAATVPPDMARVGPAELEMTIEYRVRQVGFYEPHQYGGDREMRTGKVVRKVKLGAYAIDVARVTNAQYAEFLRKSGYRPADPVNFLKHWVNGAPPKGLEDHPVVYVDLDDARAYAAWAGKRLPKEEEWQFAAQGPDGRRYPWGDQMKSGVSNSSSAYGGTTPVRAFPDGRSPFGCYDMCGNTFDWTESERSDGRNRFAMIRGGSYYWAHASVWYTDGGGRPCNFAVKMLLFCPSLDRCATVGFRCVRDLAS